MLRSGDTRLPNICPAFSPLSHTTKRRFRPFCKKCLRATSTPINILNHINVIVVVIIITILLLLSYHMYYYCYYIILYYIIIFIIIFIADLLLLIS